MELPRSLISVMLLTLAVAALAGWCDQGVARPALVLGAVYGLGATLANVWGLLAGKPLQPLYLAAFLGLAVAALLVHGRSLGRP